MLSFGRHPNLLPLLIRVKCHAHLQQNKFRKVDFRDGVKSKSRFGLSLAGLGDINRDGYEGERAALILLMRRARGLFWKCVFLSQISPLALLTTGPKNTVPSTSTMAQLRVSGRNIRRFDTLHFLCVQNVAFMAGLAKYCLKSRQVKLVLQ